MFKKRANITVLILFIYTTIMGIYFIPKQEEGQKTETIIYMGVSYVIIIALWFVLRKKEVLKEQRQKKNNEEKEN